MSSSIVLHEEIELSELAPGLGAPLITMSAFRTGRAHITIGVLAAEFRVSMTVDELRKFSDALVRMADAYEASKAEMTA